MPYSRLERLEKRLIKKWNKVEISNLNYKYNDESKITISIPKFEITKGENVSIIGVSGQGKSTFLNIFARYLEIEDPSCYKIDGKVCHDSLDIVYVAQDIDLFNLSLRDNLCLGKDISDEKQTHRGNEHQDHPRQDTGKCQF